MRRRVLNILLLISIVGYAAELNNVPCGTRLRLRAPEITDYRFLQWSDGDTSAVRLIEVHQDVHYTAFYVPMCGDYAELPVVALYDKVMMIDVKAIQQQGYWFAPEHVTWYHVKGAPDSIEDTDSGDDEEYGKGYYLTIDKSLKGTGDYYAVVDVSQSPSGMLCSSLMRTVIVHYASSVTSAPAPALEPTIARPNERQRILHLPAEEKVKVTVYSSSGQLLQTLVSDGRETVLMNAAGVAGCYQVIVECEKERYVLRYIVVQ